MSDRDYPIERPEVDPRFSLGLTLDVAEVLADHGYPTLIAGPDYADLQRCLWEFLYGTSSAQAAPGGKDTAAGGESTPRSVITGSAEVTLTALPPLTLTGCTLTELQPDFYSRVFHQLDGWLPPSWRSDEFATGTAHLEQARLDGHPTLRDLPCQVAVAYRPEGRHMTIQWLEGRTR